MVSILTFEGRIGMHESNLIVFFKSKFIKFTRKFLFQRSNITVGIRIFCAFHIGTYRTIRGHLIPTLIALHDDNEMRTVANNHSGQSGPNPLILVDSFY